MITKTIKIAGKEVTMAYCYATEIIFQRYTNSNIDSFDATNSEHVIYLVLAALVAYNEANHKTAEDIPLKDTDLMYEAKPADIIYAVKTIYEMRHEWYAVPDAEEKKEEESDGKN